MLLRPSAAFQRIKFNVLKASPTKTSVSVQEKCCKNPPEYVGKFDPHKSNIPEIQPDTHDSSGSESWWTNVNRKITEISYWRRFLRYFSHDLSVKHIIRFYGIQMCTYFRKTRASVETGGGERWIEPVSVGFGSGICSVFDSRRFNSPPGTFVDGLSTKIAAQTTTETGRHEPLLLKYLLSICMTPPFPTWHPQCIIQWALAANKGHLLSTTWDEAIFCFIFFFFAFFSFPSVVILSRNWCQYVVTLSASVHHGSTGVWAANASPCTRTSSAPTC